MHPMQWLVIVAWLIDAGIACAIHPAHNGQSCPPSTRAALLDSLASPAPMIDGLPECEAR